MNNWIKAILYIIGTLLGMVGFITFVYCFPVFSITTLFLLGIFIFVKSVKEEFDVEDSYRRYRQIIKDRTPPIIED